MNTLRSDFRGDFGISKSTVTHPESGTEAQHSPLMSKQGNKQTRRRGGTDRWLAIFSPQRTKNHGERSLHQTQCKRPARLQKNLAGLAVFLNQDVDATGREN
jgi:hypothetical protein